MILTFTPANESDSFNKKEEEKKKGNNDLLAVDELNNPIISMR